MMEDPMKKLSLILAVLLLAAFPALATSVEDLIAELESEIYAVPDLSGAFGSGGDSQGEMFADGVIAGEGTLYDDSGSGSAAADLLLLQRGFTASQIVVAGHAATLYQLGTSSVLIMPQLISGRTLVIVSGPVEFLPDEPVPPAATPAPAARSVSLTVNGVEYTLAQETGTATSESLEASFSDGARQLIIGLPATIQSGTTLLPEDVLAGSDSFPYISYIDESGIEWYALAWSRPTGVAPDLSIEYTPQMEPGDAADYSIHIETAQDGTYRGAIEATLGSTVDETESVKISATFFWVM